MLEDGLDEKQVKSMKYVVCIMCGFTCFNDITLKKQTNMKHGDILKDKKKLTYLNTYQLQARTP